MARDLRLITDGQTRCPLCTIAENRASFSMHRRDRWRGRSSNRCCPGRRPRPKAGRSRSPTGRAWRVFCGYCGAAPAGRISRSGTPRRARAGVGCGTGKPKASGCGPDGRCWRCWTNARPSTGKRDSPTRAFRPRKKGRGGRENQARKGYEVAGGGRRRGSSSGSVPGVGLAGRSHPPPADARSAERTASAGRRAAFAGWGTALQAEMPDRRQGLRRRLVAYPAAVAGDRADLPASQRPQAPAVAGRPAAATLQTALEDRTHDRLAGLLPPPVDPLERNVDVYRAYIHVACLMIAVCWL